MKSLYESILDTDNDIENSVNEKVKIRYIKEALGEFFKYLHIDMYKCDGKGSPIIINNYHRPIFDVKFYMENALDYAISKQGEDWYLDKNWYEMNNQCIEWIKEALEKFEEYLKKKNIGFKKYSGTPSAYYAYSNKNKDDVLYKFDNIGMIFFRTDRFEVPIAKRTYNFKYNKEHRLDYKKFHWTYEMKVERNIWEA